jgi:hypothetical protein
MKTILAIIATAMVVSALPAQSNTAAPVAANHCDTGMQAANMQDRQAPQSGWHHPGFQDKGPMMFGCAGMHNKFENGMGPACQMCPMPGMRMHGFMGRHFHRMLWTALLLMGIINTLLTILASIDMSKTGKFNGIWVAVILLAGIPGMAIFALFRIGDAIERARPKA